MSPSPALLDLLAGKPVDLELDRAALELARLEYPDLDVDHYIAELDRHAAAIADRAGDLNDGRRFLEAANSYLFGELGLRGNGANYYNAENSFLNRVLETGLGIPIALCLIYMEIARRLAKPVRGIGLPGHFVLRYDDGRFSTYVDAFNGGALIDEEGCLRLTQLESFDPAMLEPVGPRSILMRMINNLRGIYFSTDPEKALRLTDLLLSANPDDADEHKQRAAALLRLRRVSDALGSFRRYLELAPEAPDKQVVLDEMRNLTFWIASRN